MLTTSLLTTANNCNNRKSCAQKIDKAVGSTGQCLYRFRKWGGSGGGRSGEDVGRFGGGWILK